MIYIGSDHRGNELRSKIPVYVAKLGYFPMDLGMDIDFPIMARRVAELVLEHKDSVGILICGTGQGMTITADRYDGIRAALCNNVEDAKQAREHLNANILALGADRVGYEEAREIVKVFLTTEFSKKERYERRIRQMG
jgi:RpiB/LacA/LacB family sugar-phosphate isomerase